MKKCASLTGITKAWYITLIAGVIILLTASALVLSFANFTGSHKTSRINASSSSVLVVFFENNPNVIAAGRNFQSILAKYAQETNYYGVSHPSEPNYVAAAGGSTFGIGNDYNLTTLQLKVGNAESIVNLLHNNGFSWKEYEENYPAPGTCITSDPPSSSPYEVDHDFLIGYKTALQTIGGCSNIQNFNSTKGLWADMSNGSLPNFAFVVPNHFNSGDMNKTQGDVWLGTFLQALYASPQWKAGVLSVFITFDESYGGNGVTPWNSNKNQVPLILVSPDANMGAKVSVKADHYNLLATIEWYYNLGNLGRNDSSAAPLTGMFRSGTAPA